MKYYTVRSSYSKSVTYNVVLPPDGKAKIDKRHKLKADSNIQITINGQFPRPNPKLEKRGKSYLNETELLVLREEQSFEFYEKEGLFIVHEIPFKDLPEEKQKEYDMKAFLALKQENPKEQAQKTDEKKV